MTSLGCRPGCGACCIAPSISSPIPGMPPSRTGGAPSGKPAGVRCIQLDEDNRCKIFGDPRRPLVCSSLKASAEMCGTSDDVLLTRTHAMTFIGRLEALTGGASIESSPQAPGNECLRAQAIRTRDK